MAGCSTASRRWDGSSRLVTAPSLTWRRRSGRWEARDIRLLFIPVFALIVLWGCASRPPSIPPAPQQERVILKIDKSTQYYVVRGTTTSAIFDDVKKNGLFDTKAQRAVGLTSVKWTMDWRGIETRPAFCNILGTMTISLDITVTLPRHDQLNDLTPDIRTNWERYAARVAAHEQRHVDIYLNGAKTIQARMETILTKPSSCPELEDVVRRPYRLG